MKTLSIVIPVYNEEKRIGNTFEALTKEMQVSRGLKLEKIIFVNDGSTDKTESRIMNQESRIRRKLNCQVEVISYRENKGKGYAVKEGMLLSQSHYTLFADADMSTPLSEISKFLPFMKREIPVIIGTRKNGHSTVVKHQPIVREVLGKGFTILSNTILNTLVTDFTCGFKAFAKQAKDDIFTLTNIRGWGFDTECMFLAQRLGYSIQEVPVVWSDCPGSKVNLFVDMPKSMLDLFRIRFNSYIPYSYKKVFAQDI